MSQFAEHYRLLLYSVSDFFVGIALLYLFYHQGCLVKEKMDEMKKKETMLSVRYGADGKPKISKLKAKAKAAKDITMVEQLLDNDNESHKNLHPTALQPILEKSHDEMSEYAVKTDLYNHVSKRESINAEQIAPRYVNENNQITSNNTPYQDSFIGTKPINFSKKQSNLGQSMLFSHDG